jgi:hypothetical protein
VAFSEVMLVSITASILFLCSPGWEWYHRTVLAVSYLRVFAFFSVFESSNFISRIIRTCSYKIGLVLAVFLSVLYSLSVIAMRMYGTTLTSYNTDPILAETAWYAKRMQLNFDSFENALLTLFFCCVAGSWETFLAVTSVVFENPTVHPLFSSSLVSPVLSSFSSLFVETFRSPLYLCVYRLMNPHYYKPQKSSKAHSSDVDLRCTSATGSGSVCWWG